MSEDRYADYPPVEIEPLWDGPDDQKVQSWCMGYWNVQDLIDKTKDLTPFDLPLIHLDLSQMHFKCSDLLEFCRHGRKVEEADLKYPIILDHKGCVLDGRHRIARALLLNHTTIRAVRMPKYLLPTTPAED